MTSMKNNDSMISLLRRAARRTLGLGLTAGLLIGGLEQSVAQETPSDPVSAAESPDWPIVYSTDFENGAEGWVPTEPEGWEVRAEGEGHAYHQHVKAASYQPRVRSPHHISWLEEVEVGSFQLDVRVRSTHPDYAHRDACLFFGRQDSSHFYYVHLGKAMDDHANQIFIVDGSPRTKISTKTTEGTPWDDEWHHVRIIRDVESGRIEVYFDDMNEPAMVAENATFKSGPIGLGSFDDTTAWDDLQLRGERIDEDR